MGEVCESENILWSQYIKSEADGSNPYASPLRAENLRGLPPATVIAADIDPLRSEGQSVTRGWFCCQGNQLYQRNS
ncbi:MULTISPECIES: alpha/beta hydrolase fold domain-containing protein [unclassified Microcoleus]|uniref:alpha/beta hydrolase fold domain-containing protein n=1 Tax=unclassified Microcoleus TaxID=2642155 RepID=UPI0040409C8C